MTDFIENDVGKVSDIDPKIWGKSLWTSMYAIAVSYPSDAPTGSQILAAKKFFTSFSELLPCEDCRLHYREYLKQNPVVPHLGSNANLTRWVIDLNNSVNKRVTTEIATVKLEDILEQFQVEIEAPGPVLKKGLVIKKCKNCQNKRK